MYEGVPASISSETKSPMTFLRLFSAFNVHPRISGRYAAARPAVLPCAVRVKLHPNAVRVSSAVELCARLDATPPRRYSRLSPRPTQQSPSPSHDLRPLVYIQRQGVPHPPKNNAVPHAEPVDGSADYIACAVTY